MPFIVKNTTIPSLLDLIAPHTCRGCGRIGTVLCDRCKNNILASRTSICPNCKRPKTTSLCPNCPTLPPIFAIGSKATLLGTLIHDYKYRSVRPIGPTIADLFNQTLPQFKTPVIIVPLPTANHHIRARGLDHTFLVAKNLARLRGYQVLPMIMRAKNTVQVGSDKKTRLAQAKHAYAPNKALKTNSNATYLLFDDVWTTGASIRSAIETMYSLGLTNLAVALIAYSEI